MLHWMVGGYKLVEGWACMLHWMVGGYRWVEGNAKVRKHFERIQETVSY
jgi:hypothetical protein